MSDSNLEAFYAELDSRMAMSDDENWQNFTEHRPNLVANCTSGSSEPFPSNDNPALRMEPPPTILMPSKRKASPGYEQPLSAKRGTHRSTMEGRKKANTPTAASAPVSIQDMSSLIEEFTDVIAESPATKRDSKAKPLEETSIITTPGRNTSRSGAQARSEASVVRPKLSVTATAKQSAGKKRAAKAKPELVTPTEFARRLQEQVTTTNSTSDFGSRKARQLTAKLPVKAVQPSQYLKDHVIFYTGGDLTYASARTRGCMSVIHRHGGTVLPTFDPARTTHIVTETDEKNTLRALGLKNLSEIPLEIPTVKWSWVISGKSIPGEKDRQQMDYEFMHAAFPSRMDAGRSLAGKGKGKQKLDVGASNALITGALQASKTPPRAASPDSSSSCESSRGIDEEVPGALSRQPPDNEQLAGPSHRESRLSSRECSPPAKNAPRKKLAGFICDDPTGTSEANSAPCVNQDIIDQLSELAELHRTKPTQDDKWRVIGYTKAYIFSRTSHILNGVGEKTALKIIEIIETGALRRIDAERTEDVSAVQLFQGIYGVGQSTARAWYLAGCRTLEDIKQRKGGIVLSRAQEIGLKYYDDINTRIPREEASEIFGEIKSIALSLDPKLFVDIMGSYRRGKATCGDIDVMITRSTDDGRTHAGILPKLLSALRSAGIVTEDLSLSPDASDNLECTYRGLCIRPTKAGQHKQPRIQRRIDILAIPWECRGAALIYYTGDDIFNRSMRLKANKMGYSLNQRGLFAGVVRSTGDRSVKTNAGGSPLSDGVFQPLCPFPAPKDAHVSERDSRFGHHLDLLIG
ncbi:hypothetical protein BJV74DRAFT_883693 [Russula compacta]|nr:hypothetical protein BJV74DRAFT_883693 [Russula compacta]